MKRKNGPCDECTDPMDCGSWNTCFEQNRPLFAEGFIENLTYSKESRDLKRQCILQEKELVIAKAKKLKQEWEKTISTISYTPLRDYARKN